MWLSKLPDPQYVYQRDEAPSFSENILFTEKINYRYSCPEHTSSFGIITVLDGDGSFTVNRKQEKLNKENFLVINSNSRLSINIPGNYSNPALLFFQSHLPGIVASSLNCTYEKLLNDPANSVHTTDFAILERLHPMHGGLRNKLLLLAELGGGSSSFAALKADIIVRSILEDMVVQNDLASKESFNINVKKRSTRIELYKRVCIARDWIEANYNQPLTLDDLAVITCMNSQHFLRSFKQLFLITPHQYLINTRLENAKRMLLASDEPIHVICRNTGMESLSSFSLLFKQRFGVAPSRFRDTRFFCHKNI